MNGIDIAVLVVIGISVALGIYWGLIRQVLSLVGIFAGTLLAGRYGPDVAGWLSSFIDSPALTQALGFVVVLVAISSLASLLASLIHRFAGLLFLGWLDHLAGGVIGLVQGALVASVLLLLASAIPNETLSAALSGSQSAGILLRVFGALLLLMPEQLRSAAQTVFGLP
ncbi:MAG: CvpA family protein [Roseiflexaceae bacterium]